MDTLDKIVVTLVSVILIVYFIMDYFVCTSGNKRE